MQRDLPNVSHFEDADQQNVRSNYECTSIMVNNTCRMKVHRDKNNYGPSCLVALGNYEGGRLITHGSTTNSEGVDKHDVKRRFVRFDGNVEHEVEQIRDPSKGQRKRYSIVYFVCGSFPDVIVDTPLYQQLEDLGFRFPTPTLRQLGDLKALRANRQKMGRGFESQRYHETVLQKVGEMEQEEKRTRKWQIWPISRSKFDQLCKQDDGIEYSLPSHDAELENHPSFEVPWRVKNGQYSYVSVTPYVYPGHKEWIQRERVLVGMISYDRAQKGNFIRQHGESGFVFLVVLRSQFEQYKSIKSGCSFLVIETGDLQDDIKDENPLLDKLKESYVWDEWLQANAAGKQQILEDMYNLPPKITYTEEDNDGAEGQKEEEQNGEMEIGGDDVV